MIYFDGKCKSQYEIAKILSLSGEGVKKKRHSALYKLAASKEVLSYSHYAQNPDLVLRLHDIYNWTKDIPFTDKYPDFNSYFSEYSKEEIQKVLLELENNEINFLNKIKQFEGKVPNFYYGIEQAERLFRLIKKVYGKLIERNGRRTMITKLSSSYVSRYGNNLNKLRDFYQIFGDYDKNMVIYIVTKLTNARRELLKRIYGPDLNKVLTPNAIVKIDSCVISTFNDLVRIMKIQLKELKTNGILKEKLIVVRMQTNGLTGIYQILSFASIDMINAGINNLFYDEINILKKVFGEDLTDDNYDKNIEKLSEIEFAIYSSIMIRLQKELKCKEQSNKQSARNAFYKVFYDLGYTKESVDIVLNCNDIKNLVTEYLSQETSAARKEKILEIIYQILCKEYGHPFNYLKFKARIKQA